MPVPVEKTSTITAKGQTTIPKSIRQALGVGRGGRVSFRLEGDVVTVHRADDQEHDTAMDAFLAFLAGDIRERPQGVAALTPTLAARLEGLAGGGEIDLDSPIHGEVAL